MNRRGDWMRTVSGGRFYPLDPRPEEVILDDAAHALGHVCRFGGHILAFFSVAQHSVNVSEDIELELGGTTEEAFAGLNHDLTEAYLGDMVRPLKRMMHAYQEAEKAVEAVIITALDIRVSFDAPIVRFADERMLATEAVQVCGADISTWSLRADPVRNRVIVPWSPTEAKARFLARFAELDARRKAER